MHGAATFLCESIIISILDYGHWLDSWQYETGIYALAFHLVEKNKVVFFFFSFLTWICTGVDEARCVSRVPYLSCLSFFLLGRSLNEQLSSLPALSLNQTPTFPAVRRPSSVSIPSKENKSVKKKKTKKKPVAPPETTGLLVDCSVITKSHKQKCPEKFLKKDNKKKIRSVEENACKALLLYPPIA